MVVKEQSSFCVVLPYRLGGTLWTGPVYFLTTAHEKNRKRINEPQSWRTRNGDFFSFFSFFTEFNATMYLFISVLGWLCALFLCKVVV